MLSKVGKVAFVLSPARGNKNEKAGLWFVRLATEIICLRYFDTCRFPYTATNTTR